MCTLKPPTENPEKTATTQLDSVMAVQVVGEASEELQSLHVETSGQHVRWLEMVVPAGQGAQGSDRDTEEARVEMEGMGAKASPTAGKQPM